MTLPLPTREGVGPSCVGLTPGPWPTIADFLVERFPAIPRTTWAARMAAGTVVDEHGAPVTMTRPHEAPLRVYYYRALDSEVRIPFDEVVLFQDDELVVADKPPFLPVTPTGKYVQESLLVRLKRKLGLDDLAPLHRIDRGTAGLVLFSVRPATRGAYTTLFAQRVVEKRYEAVVHWRTDAPLPAVYRSRLADDAHFMRMREVAGEPNSETGFALREATEDRALLDLSPVTGRKHQLRVHCMALGLPIENDPIYPELLPADSDDFAKPLQLLAKWVAFRDPLSGLARRFESPRALSLK
ncbi:pseudouridine synthase [Variovorax sp. PAMC 28711]|uniref:pseudouridine synthase n=1 Tax=Variovorax sp. PAMC 28711 TaxID=1795631 RepID=UPI00078EAC78|nr:pseudouridine synthase [Variovorax sp. PAMC 28711]AMM25209.1 pseudouridine synthase [Variovorax sp. PAMC 28711]